MREDHASHGAGFLHLQGSKPIRRGARFQLAFRSGASRPVANLNVLMGQGAVAVHRTDGTDGCFSGECVDASLPINERWRRQCAGCGVRLGGPVSRFDAIVVSRKYMICLGES